ncbi:hypothetical protein GOP47_0018860 [Adiantum capillus-veneris]|uniref:Pre-rRNA-processing protein Ipi1 N-terminal domain-containing protein n=1 Tax=Adiantum capillus-veneris TaxID=13818 RepID=A0A9D4ZB41_ADICA|nr:hypothetical protein GOP47_0018860 [Adiantum capillus-veneris]
MAPPKKKKLSKARGIGVDFKKVKHKVGRKLAPSSNVTKVDVKSKAIVLPGQSVAQEKEGLSTNNRRLTLKELLTQTTHHNDKVRKDALYGIKDLISRHPKELSLHAVTIMEKLCPRISDKSKAVRQALLDLLRTTIFSELPEVLMRPLVPVIMAYIFSAMTNLAADIRISAFRFLDVLILAYPLLVAADYATQITQSFVDFLGKLGIAGQMRGQLLEMLHGLLQFLSAYRKRSRLSKLTASSVTKEGQKLEDNSRLLENGGIYGLAMHWYKSVMPELIASWRMNGDKSNKGQGFPIQLAEALVKALSNCWAECAPLVCSGQSPDKDSMECMIKVCAAIHLLILIIEPRLEQKLRLDADTEASGNQMRCSGSAGKGALPQKWMKEHMVPLLHRQLIGSFPICAPPINLPKKVEELLLYLNINILEVILDSIIAGDLQLYKEHRNITNLLDYFEDVLDGRMLSSLGLSPGSVDKNNTDSYLKLLVPFVPCLLRYLSRTRQLRLLKAFTNVFRSCKPTSKLKLVCLSCIAEILQPSDLNRGQAGNGTLVTNSFDFQKQWLQMLPKLLWELKESHFSSSLAILKVLHYLGRSAPQGSVLAEEFLALQPTLIPFFSTSHLSKLNQGQRLHGPFMKLPQDCQNLAIDLLFYYDRFSTAFLKAIAHCLCPDLQVTLVVRCIEVIRAVYSRGSIELSDYLSFIFTVVVESVQDSCPQIPQPGDSEMDRAPLYRRQRIIIGLLCSCLNQIGDQRLLLHLLNPSICHVMVSPLPPLPSYGLIRIISILGTFANGLFIPKSLFESLPDFLKDYLVSLFMERCFRKKTVDGNELLINPFLHPCLCILSKSAKLTERVLQQLCAPSSPGRDHLHASVAALTRLFRIVSVRSRLSTKVEDSVLLQRFEGDRWLDIFQLEEGNVLSAFQTLSRTVSLAYGWDKAANSHAVTQ